MGPNRDLVGTTPSEMCTFGARNLTQSDLDPWVQTGILLGPDHSKCAFGTRNLTQSDLDPWVQTEILLGPNQLNCGFGTRNLIESDVDPWVQTEILSGPHDPECAFGTRNLTQSDLDPRVQTGSPMMAKGWENHWGQATAIVEKLATSVPTVRPQKRGSQTGLQKVT